MLIESFPDDYIIYRNRQVFGREFDMAMLIPDVGIAVFEIKGWRESTVLRIENGDTVIIKTDDGEEKATPQKQVRGYRFAIERRLLQDLGAKPIVFCMVVYPQISQACYLQKNLKVITEPQFTVLKEDMLTSAAIQAKLAQAVNEVRMWNRAKFDEEFMYNTRCLFEGDIARYTDDTDIVEDIKKYPQPAYSIFLFRPAGAPFSETELNQLAASYSSGTKLYAVVGDNDQLKQIVAALDKALDKKCLYRTKGRLDVRYEAAQKHYPPLASVKNQFTAFNCAVTTLAGPVHCQGFQLNDGIEKDHHDDLIEISKASGFNYDQYAVEHTPIDYNIVIRAGAGTGKTFTMVSRIGFIAHSCAGSLLDLLDRVSMITFTNDAADQMRQKLKDFFRNYYLITENKTWLHLVTKIDQMQISTIHSYAKKLIDALGIEYGYGCDVSITSSEFTRQAYVSKLVNEHIVEKSKYNANFVDRLGMPMYSLVANIVDFIQKLQNKSVDVAKLTKENFGTGPDDSASPELHELLSDIIPRVEQAYQDELLKENKIHLSSIMSLLQMLMLDENGQRRVQLLQKTTPSYLFVDEFQDTDNTQIEILIKLCELLQSKLFVVGDVKQCIYRFRGATEEAFDQLPIRGNESKWREYALRRNYRTDTQLLDLFDSSFRVWGQSDDKLLVYKPERDQLYGTKSLNTGLPKAQFYRQLQTRTEDGRMETLFDEVKRIQRWIAQDIQNGVKLSEEDKTIAILVRENWQAEAIKAEGKRRGFQIHTHTGGDLYQTPAAVDMLALANALLHFDEPEYLFSLLASNFFGVSVPYSNLYKIRKKVSENFWNPEECRNDMRNYLVGCINDGLTKMPREFNTWDSIVTALRTKPVLQMMYEIYACLKPERTYAKGNKWDQTYYRMNVDLLFEQVLATCNANNLTINSFARSLNICVISGVSVNSRIPPVENTATIQCITVHKSKGLEYGHVIVPFANFRIDMLKRARLNVSVAEQNDQLMVGYAIEQPDTKNSYRNNYYNEQAEKAERSREEARILYVAMTRAIRSFSWIAQENVKGLAWQGLVRTGED
jgi:superfamily I DNA/RNA helicase